MNRFAITAEGPSSDIMNRRENLIGYTYLAPTEPARFIAGSRIPVTDVRPIKKPFIYRNETEQLRERLKEVEDANALHLARIRSQAEDNAVYKGFWKQEQGEHKRLGELAAGLRTQVDAARKDNDILTGMVAAHYDTLKQYEAQLKTARTALEGAKSDIEGCFIACRCGEQQDLKDLDLMHFIDKALALIDAGQKGGK